MAVEVERIKIVIEGDDQGIQKIEGSVEGARKSVRKLGDDAKKVLADIRASANAATGEIARTLHENVTRPAIDAAKSWIEAGSDIGEQLSKVKTLVGENATQIEAWSKTTATALGVSRREALTFTGVFANIFRPMGFGKKQAAEMSRTLVTLAADLASFNNTTIEDALLALQSGINGETEPLRRFGVSLQEVTIKQEALRLGLIKSLKDGLSPAQKAAATYSVILKQTSIAQGDVARTSGGLANQQRILAAEAADLRAEIGARLVPAALALVRVGREWLQVWSAIPAPLQNVALALAAVLALVGPLVLGFRQVGVIGLMVKDALAGLLPLLSGIAAAVGLTLGELALVVAGLAAAAAALYTAWRTNFGGIRDLTNSVVQSLSGVLESFRDWLAKSLPTALAYVSLHIQGVIAALRVFGGALGKVLTAITGMIAEVVRWVSTHWREMLQVLLNMQPLYWLYQLFTTIFGGIQKVVGNSLDGISEKLKEFFKLLTYLTLPGQLARLTGADKVILKAWDAYKTATKGFSAEAVAAERTKIEAELTALVKSVASIGKSFKLPALPQMPGLATGLDFKGMGLPGLPEDGASGKKREEDLKRRLAQINEELMRLTLDRYSFERWQARKQFDEDIALGVKRVRAQEVLSAALRKINKEEGEAHQRILEELTDKQLDEDSKRLKGWERIKDALTKSFKGYNDWVQKFNKETSDEFAREQKAAAEEVAKSFEETAGVSERIAASMADMAAQFDAVGGRANYFSDTLAKLNLDQASLTAEQMRSVQVYADAWQELDRLNAKQRAIQSTASELQGVFRNAFAAGLSNARDFTRELVGGVREAITRQLADLASAYVVKQLMNLFGMRNSGLSESARSARNDLLLAAAAIAASATVLKDAAREARKAAGAQAGAAAGAAFGPWGALGGAIFGGMFAEGGTMRPGTTNLVGEAGPELVTMGSGGRATVTPLGSGGGGGGPVTFNFYGGVHGVGGAEQLKRELRRGLALGG